MDVIESVWKGFFFLTVFLLVNIFFHCIEREVLFCFFFFFLVIAQKPRIGFKWHVLYSRIICRLEVLKPWSLVRGETLTFITIPAAGLTCLQLTNNLETLEHQQLNRWKEATFFISSQLQTERCVPSVLKFFFFGTVGAASWRQRERERESWPWAWHLSCKLQTCLYNN